MDATFSIDVDVTASVLRITMDGFFDAQGVHRLIAARAQACGRLLCAPNRHVTLIDVRGMSIQTRDVVATFTAILNDQALASRALGFIVAPSLARSQIKRAAAGRNAGFFGSIEEAERWLKTVTCLDAVGAHERSSVQAYMDPTAPRTAASTTAFAAHRP